MLVDCIGVLAGVFAVAATYARNFQRLRTFAIGSNFLFICYAISADLWPVLVLHCILLPLNWRRMSELARLQSERVNRRRGVHWDASERWRRRV